VPLVFYQGQRGWRHSTEFADLFPEVSRGWSFVPRFVHLLVDQTGMGPESVEGGVKGRIVQLLMMAAFGRHGLEAIERAAQLVSELSPGGGLNELRLFVFYVMATQDREGVDAFGKMLQRYELEHGGEVMSYAQELLQEGEKRGEQRGEQRAKVEVIEGFLRVGVDWQVIENATGINEAQFRLLKQQVENVASEETAES
jgi:hypothetical protein